MRDIINLDANASCPMPREIADELASRVGGLLNPSSIHGGGQRSKHLLDEAREEISALIDLPAGGRLVFTSGATEANNMAIGAVRLGGAPAGGSAHLVYSAIEHPSVTAKAEELSRQGYDCVRVGPDERGAFSPDRFVSSLSGDSRLVSVMLANNETGQILPAASIARAVRSLRPGVLVHSDAVQALGKIEVSFGALGVDMLSLSGHKVGALAGIGALAIGPDLELPPVILGGPQEGRLRGGTENVLGIVSFGIAARILRRDLGKRKARLRELSERLATGIFSTLPGVSLNAVGTEKLSNTLSVRVEGVRADDLVVALDLSGVLASSGAACASGKPEPSPVLLAMGLDENGARETVRLSLHSELGVEDIDRAVSIFCQCVNRMRARAAGRPEAEELRA